MIQIEDAWGACDAETKAVFRCIGFLAGVALLVFGFICLVYVGWNSLPSYPHQSRWQVIGTTGGGGTILENKINGDIKVVKGEVPEVKG